MKRYLYVIIALTLVSALSAVAALPISVVVGPRAGLFATKGVLLPDGLTGYFDIGAKCDVVFDMTPLKGYLAITPALDYGLNIEQPGVLLASIAVKARYPHHRFVPYGYFGGAYYSEGTNLSAVGAFITLYGDSSGFITTMGGGVDIRLTDLIAINAEFQALDFGQFIGGLGGVSFFL
ncbi:MAG: hypothetical protein GY771_05815 [bacterium]|nr:hypothetical protein [bacterium]